MGGVPLIGCGAAADSLFVGDGHFEDASFGNGADDRDAGSSYGDASGPAPSDDDGLDDGDDSADGDGSAAPVRVRILHGIVNAEGLTACFDPDRVLDAPETAGDESADGASPPLQLGLTASFGEVSSYLELEPGATGTITLHRLPAADALDGGTAAPGDAGAMAAADAGAAMDGAVATPVPPACVPETMEAAMPLPFTGAWLDPKAPQDLDALNVASTLEAGATVTLLASGVLLDAAQLAQRVEQERAAYLAAHPEDSDGAQLAARTLQASLEASRGPRLVPASHAESAPQSGSFVLSLAQLVPDVPRGADLGGALRLCVTIDDVAQSVLPPVEQAPFAFRTRALAGQFVGLNRAFTFRAFAAEAFDAEGKECASTSLSPVAELSVPKNELVAGRSYTLVALGALGSDELCSPTMPNLARASCPASSDELAARLKLFED